MTIKELKFTFLIKNIKVMLYCIEMEYVIDRLRNMLAHEFIYTKIPSEELRKVDLKAYERSAAIANERIPQLQKAIELIEAETSEKQALNIGVVIKQRELFDNFYKWLDDMTEAEYDYMSLTEKVEKYFFKTFTK